VVESYGYSERKACQFVGANRASVRYVSRKPGEELLKEKITSIAHEKRRYGYRRIHVLLKRAGVHINHKKLFRIYKQLGLKVLKRGGRKRALGTRIVSMPLTKANQEWSLDFVHDALTNGRRIRMLTVVDDFTSESIKIAVDTSLSGRRVCDELEQVIESRGKPGRILSDGKLRDECLNECLLPACKKLRGLLRNGETSTMSGALTVPLMEKLRMK
jgi:putative transposase